MKYLLKKKTEAAGSKISCEILLGISFCFPNVAFCELILNFYTEISLSLCNFLSLLPECFELTYLQIADHMLMEGVHDTLVTALSEILISLS